mmetsp:Transcript_181/g.553  ORF Transcript_181/g.553 Transcript_181/m.553 type:complete len:293 (+) Transcript_181:187-1065(+)
MDDFVVPRRSSFRTAWTSSQAFTEKEISHAQSSCLCSADQNRLTNVFNRASWASGCSARASGIDGGAPRLIAGGSGDFERGGGGGFAPITTGVAGATGTGGLATTGAGVKPGKGLAVRVSKCLTRHFSADSCSCVDASCADIFLFSSFSALFADSRLSSFTCMSSAPLMDACSSETSALRFLLSGTPDEGMQTRLAFSAASRRLYSQLRSMRSSSCFLTSFRVTSSVCGTPSSLTASSTTFATPRPSRRVTLWLKPNLTSGCCSTSRMPCHTDSCMAIFQQYHCGSCRPPTT